MIDDLQLAPEQAGDQHAIETLHDLTFGPGRYAKAAFRIREQSARGPVFAFVARDRGSIIGSVRLTAVTIGGTPALLLGPLAVHPDWAGRGAGRALMRESLEAARAAGHRLVVLVGDEPYYARFGFFRARRGSLTFPGPVDPDRVLVAELVPGAADGVAGLVAARSGADG